MPKHSRLFLRVVLLLSSLILALASALPFSATADDLSQIKVSAVDTSKYPNISFSFWPFDSDGNFVNSVTTSNLHVFENDQPVELTDLQLLEPGTHIVLAVNEGPTLANAYAGKVRLQSIKAAWTTWMSAQAITTMDDFSLINNESVLQDQLTRPAAWVDALDSYQPNLAAATPSLNCMTLALDKLSNLNDRKTKALMLVTPLPNANQLAGLQTEGAQAKEDGIRLFIWLVGPQTYSTENAAAVLQQIAESTGGSFFIFSGAETLPTVASYLDPLHYQYHAVYKTSIQESGTYNLAVRVDQTNYQQDSGKISFDLKVQPPNPIFLSPPSTITRSWSQDAKTHKWSLVPSQQTIDMMLEFPDGHTRALASSELSIDGSVVARNSSTPFDKFVWDLSPYTKSGTHLMQVSVQDEAGLTASTIKMTVSIVVEEKPLGAVARFIKGIGLQTLGIVIFLVLIGAGLVVLFFRLRLRTPTLNQNRASHRQAGAAVEAVKVSPSGGVLQGELAPASLVYLGSGESTLSANSIFPLSDQNILIGTDPERCGIVLDSPSVSPVHAEITVDAALNFFLHDRGSVAGTWVNYDPAAQAGTYLEDGDIIHIGACEFRFEQPGGYRHGIRVEPISED